MERNPSQALLSDLELRVVELVAQGYPNRQIAGELSLGEHAVERILRGIADRLGVADRLELVLYAIVHEMTGASASSVTRSRTRQVARAMAV